MLADPLIEQWEIATFRGSKVDLKLAGDALAARVRELEKVLEQITILDGPGGASTSEFLRKLARDALRD
jgi:hypothetical protein